jgi:hypothetical protein
VDNDFTSSDIYSVFDDVIAASEASAKGDVSPSADQDIGLTV